MDLFIVFMRLKKGEHRTAEFSVIGNIYTGQKNQVNYTVSEFQKIKE